MTGHIDLHAHTTASDGSLSPTELIELAVRSGLQAVAVTDHDTFAGIEEAQSAGARLGIRVIAGIEINTSYKPELHMLGFFFDDRWKTLRTQVDALREGRRQRNLQILDKLAAIGVCVTEEEWVAQAGEAPPGRPHLARVLTLKGHALSVQDAFARYLTPGRPGYAKREDITPEQAIGIIRSAGGVPVMAHPQVLGLNTHGLRKLLQELKTAGLAGIEAYYNDHEDSYTECMLRLCAELDLAPSGGSDFHGAFKPGLRLGTGRGNLRVPADLLDELERRSRPL